MFPVIVPSIPFDSYLSANIAIALTGMGVDMGAKLSMDFSSGDLFDNEKVNELNALYASGKITMERLGDMLREYVGGMTHPMGFKMRHTELLPFCRRVWPEMTMIVGLGNQEMAEDDILDACLLASRPGLLIGDMVRAADASAFDVSRAARRAPTLHIPIEQFNTPEQRPRALKRMAEWIGGKAEGGEVGRMVEAAQRKLYFVYEEGEKRARNRRHNEESAVAAKDDNGKSENSRAQKA